MYSLYRELLRGTGSKVKVRGTVRRVVYHKEENTQGDRVQGQGHRGTGLQVTEGPDFRSRDCRFAVDITWGQKVTVVGLARC